MHHHASVRWSGLVVLLGSLGGSLSWGQDVTVQFFPCAEVRFFTPACPAPVLQDVPPAPPPPPQQATGGPLFPPNTVSPYTPPFLLQLLEQPTLDHARAFVAWQRAQLQRLQEVQALLRQVQSEDRLPSSPSGNVLGESGKTDTPGLPASCSAGTPGSTGACAPDLPHSRDQR